jgi:hypothetical protein
MFGAGALAVSKKTRKYQALNMAVSADRIED